MDARKKKILIAVAGAAAMFLVVTLWIVLAVNKYSLTLNLPREEKIVLEYGTSYEEPDVTAIYKGTLLHREGTMVEVKQTGSVDWTTLGTYEVLYTAVYRNKMTSARRIVIVQDTIPPEITLVSHPGTITNPMMPYEEEGFTAVDNHDGDITDRVIRKEADGVVTYSVVDRSGNWTMVTREIRYQDAVPPLITLNGGAEIVLELGKEYVESGFVAMDDCDGNITDAVTVEGTVDASRTGCYTLTYRVKDSSENFCEVQRTVTVVDKTAPSLELNGDYRMYVKLGSAYVEPGYGASDNVDGDLTSKVQISGGVDTGKSGTYLITYTVTDDSGNTAAATRSVYVYRQQASANTVNPGDKVVYLTFDDGPGQYTAQLLDILDKYGVKATFFVTDQFSDYRYMIGETARRGHTIALHSYSHEYSDIYRSEEAFYADLQKMSDICVAQTGVAPTILRFPGGTANTISRHYCTGIMSTLAVSVGYHGYFYCDWNVDSGDTSGTTSADVVAQNVINGIQRKSVAVVLQHDIKGYSVEAVEQILFWGIENGYTFLPITESTPMIHQDAKN